MEQMNKLFMDSQDYIVHRIKQNEYPSDHVFNSKEFTSSDYVVLIMVYIKMFLKESDLINDYIDNKLKANNHGKFDYEKYFQGLNELTFLYYLLIGKAPTSAINFVYYEGFSPYNKQKKLEYQIAVNNSALLNVEIKTITCDPIFKEADFRVNCDKQYVKKYFHDADLTNVNNIEDMIVLEESTHDRQLRKNIKKIVEKFSGNKIPDVQMVNIGVIVIQFATSIQEFYSYLFNEEKGILKDLEYENLDCLVFFSLTSRPTFDMQDMFDTGHVFTIQLNQDPYVTYYLQQFRLDNVIARKTNSKFDTKESIRKYINNEYGIFNFIIDKNNKCFFVPAEFTSEDICAYSQYVNGETDYPVFHKNDYK